MVRFNKKLFLFFLVITMLLLVGCTKTIEEVTADDSYLDTTVSIKGTVSTSLKIGTLSGYTLTDKNDDKIIVSTHDLPEEGDSVTARGTLKKGLLGLGYYIDEK